MHLRLELKASEGLPEAEGLLTVESKERYNWLINHTPIDDLYDFPGGTVAYSLFKASRYCYVYGHYLASVVLGLTYIENTLYGLLEDSGRAGFRDRGLTLLNRKALICGLITDEIYEVIDHTRKLRNKIPPFNSNGQNFNGYGSNHFNRIEIHEKDARNIMTIMMHLLTTKL